MPKKLLTYLLIGLIVLVTIGLITLGNWQLRRLSWKTELIDRIEQRVSKEPVSAPLLTSDTVSKYEHEYLRIEVSGKYLHKLETAVLALTDEGGGYWILTPLVSEDSITIINRGFVPEEGRHASIRLAGQLEGEQHIIGLIRLTEPGGLALRKNVPEEERWYSRDVEAIAKARGLNGVQPYFIDAEWSELPQHSPQGGMTRLQFSNNHLIYALTWYGLALLLPGLTVTALMTHKRDKEKPETP